MSRPVLSPGDVWVGRGQLTASGLDGAAALALLHVAERALPAALERLGARHRDQVIVVNQLAVRLLVRGGASALSQQVLAERWAEGLCRRLSELVQPGDRAKIGDQVAWFESPVIPKLSNWGLCAHVRRTLLFTRETYYTRKNETTSAKRLVVDGLGSKSLARCAGATARCRNTSFAMPTTGWS
jgi:hypothetical protein